MPDLNTSGYSPLQSASTPEQQAILAAQQGINKQIGFQEGRLQQGSDLANAGFSQQGAAFQQQGQDYSALKDLLLKTQQSLGNQQFGPSKQEQALRTLGAIAGEKPGLQGMAGVGAAAAGTAAQGMQETREGEIAKQQLMAKYGIDAQQAGMMAHQLQGQMASNLIQRGQNQANNASTALNSAYMRALTAGKDQSQMDPRLVAELAEAKAEAAIRGQLAGIGQGQGGAPAGAQPGAPGADQPPDPITEAYATYKMQFPNQPQARGAAGLLGLQQWQNQLNKILAVNPDFQQGNKTIADKVRTQFDTKNADNMRFLGNVAGHIDQYDKLMQQLQQSGLQEGTPAWNSLIQHFSTAMGHPEVTNLKGVQSFLGPEFAKVLVPSGATGAERTEREEMIRGSMSPDQWAGLKGTLQGTLGTQLSGFENELRSSLYFMPKKLVDQEWNAKMGRPELTQIMQMHNQMGGTKPMPTAEKLQAYANKYTGGDLEKAKEALTAHGYK